MNSPRKHHFWVLMSCLMLPSSPVLADSASPAPESQYVQQPPTELPTLELGLTFAVVYAAQWSEYLVSQHSVIQDHGSFKNWYSYPFQPHFDRDGFDYNMFKHSLAGGAYYLFYRSRGYSEPRAFLWTVLSSLAFEFTIETITEPPSFQDMYQTPVYGTILGIGLERGSLFFHSTHHWLGRAMGYILNPFTILPFSRYGFSVQPTASTSGGGALVSLHF